MLPAEVTDGVKERVVRAELEYKKNGKGGVRKTHVVLAVNHLAEKFNAPDFAKTDHRQVKLLRARLRTQAPSFFAPDPDDNNGYNNPIKAFINSDEYRMRFEPPPPPVCNPSWEELNSCQQQGGWWDYAGCWCTWGGGPMY